MHKVSDLGLFPENDLERLFLTVAFNNEEFVSFWVYYSHGAQKRISCRSSLGFYK